MPLPQGQARPQARPPARPKISPSDRDLVQYLIQFESFGAQFVAAKQQLPEKTTLSDLFTDTEIRNWVRRIESDPVGYSKLKLAPETWLGDGISQELRTVMMEGLLRESVAGEGEQLEALLKKATFKVWAQLSHEMRRKMVEAETSQDMKNFEELSKQFLDLQKKLKEFEDSYVTGKTT